MAAQTFEKPKAVLKKKGPKVTPKLQSKKREAPKDLSETYDEFKQFEGRQYTGMKVGRSHKWYYGKGEWKETK